MHALSQLTVVYRCLRLLRFPGPFLYYPSRQYMPAPLRAFVDFIKAMPAQ